MKLGGLEIDDELVYTLSIISGVSHQTVMKAFASHAVGTPWAKTRGVQRVLDAMQILGAEGPAAAWRFKEPLQRAVDCLARYYELEKIGRQGLARIKGGEEKCVTK